MTTASQNPQVPPPAAPENSEMEKVQRLVEYKFGFVPASVFWGLAGGLGMAAFFLLVQLAGAGDSVLLNFLMYLPMIVVLGAALKSYRAYVPKGKFFQKGIGFGAVVTLLSTATLCVAALAMGAVGQRLVMEKFNLKADSAGDLFAVIGTTFMEGLVVGLIATFIWLQTMKSPEREKFETPEARGLAPPPLGGIGGASGGSNGFSKQPQQQKP